MLDLEWLNKAIEALNAGADKISKDNITAYRCDGIIRVDIKVK